MVAVRRRHRRSRSATAARVRTARRRCTQTVTTISTVGFREVGEFARRRAVAHDAPSSSAVVGTGAGTRSRSPCSRSSRVGWASSSGGAGWIVTSPSCGDRRRAVRLGPGRSGRCARTGAAQGREQPRGAAAVCGRGRRPEPGRGHRAARGRHRRRARSTTRVRAAGIGRAAALVAALAGDAENLFVTLSRRKPLTTRRCSRARARQDDSVSEARPEVADRAPMPRVDATLTGTAGARHSDVGRSTSSSAARRRVRSTSCIGDGSVARRAASPDAAERARRGVGSRRRAARSRPMDRRRAACRRSGDAVDRPSHVGRVADDS